MDAYFIICIYIGVKQGMALSEWFKIFLLTHSMIFKISEKILNIWMLNFTKSFQFFFHIYGIFTKILQNMSIFIENYQYHIPLKRFMLVYLPMYSYIGTHQKIWKIYSLKLCIHNSKYYWCNYYFDVIC